MIEKIHALYERLNDEFFISQMPYGPMNTKELRDKFQYKLALELPDCMIICDETNNFPDVIYGNCLSVRINWSDIRGSHKYSYCNLLFGQPEARNKLREQYPGLYDFL